MTEADWLAATDPAKVMKYLRTAGTGRRLRLLAAAAARRVEPLLSARVCRLALDMAFRLADEPVPEEAASDLRRAAWEYIRAHGGTRPRPGVNADAAAVKAIHPLPGEAARLAAWEAAKALTRERDNGFPEWDAALRSSQEELMPLVRDIFGNPFRPVAADPSWLTSTAVSLAEGIYAEEAFDRLPILADALMDAGCDDADVLAHCRGEGPHVRGCWVVDLVLGRE